MIHRHRRRNPPPHHHLAGLLALPLLLSTASLGVVIPGDPADGEIRFDNSTVQTAAEVHRLGRRGAGGSELTTSIYFFELPDLTAADVLNASLQFSFLGRTGDFLANPAGADIWGLGFVSSPAINTNWHLLADLDARTGSDLGTGIGGNPVVKLSDNFLTNDSNDPTPDTYRMALACPGLTAFIKLLYTQGASAGDYAVLRINFDDEPTNPTERGFDLASADATDPATRPTLSINEHSIQLFDPFNDGDRADGPDPMDTAWFKVTNALNLSIADDSAGIGGGNALFADMLNPGERFVGSFPALTLTEPGDFVQLRCTFRSTLHYGSSEAFRILIASSEDNPATSDTPLGSGLSPYQGYMARMSTAGFAGTFGDLSSVGMPAGSFLGGATDFLARNTGALPIVEGDVHTLLFTITRASASDITTRVELRNPTTTAVLNGMDPGIGNDTDLATYERFDAIGMGVGNNNEQIDFFVDNILVETNAFKIQEHTAVLAESAQLALITQPETTYALDESPDPLPGNWNDTGYLLAGDGSLLQLHGPPPLDPTKFYRLRVLEPSLAIFTDNLAAFNSSTDFGDGSTYGAVVGTPPPACPFGNGNALRVFDFTAIDKPELQAELAAPILGPFQITLQSCNQSVSASTFPSINWRMANSGQSINSSSRSAFTLSWHADHTFSASYRSPTDSVEHLVTPPQTPGVHDLILVGNGSNTEPFSYTLSGPSRTLQPLSYDLYIDGILLNSAAAFINGLRFSPPSPSNYDPTLGLQRCGLISSSDSNTDPDVWFDNILLRTPWSPGETNITQVTVGPTEAFSFASTPGTTYTLQRTTAPPAPIPYWQQTGLQLLGNGSTQFLFDPAGFDSSRLYRIIEMP